MLKAEFRGRTERRSGGTVTGGHLACGGSVSGAITDASAGEYALRSGDETGTRVHRHGVRGGRSSLDERSVRA